MKTKWFLTLLSAFLILAVFAGLVLFLYPKKKEISFSKNTNQVLEENKPQVLPETEKEENKSFSSRIKELFQPLAKKENKKTPTPSPEKNYTDYFSKLLFQKNLNSLSGKDDLNVDQEKELAKLKEKFLSQREIIGSKDLNVIEDNSTSSIVRFGNIFYQLLSQSGPFSTTIEVFDVFSKEGDTSGFQGLAERNQEIIDYSKKILVPSSYQNLFLDYLNAISLEKEIFKALADYKKDPLKAIVAFKLFPENSKKIAGIAIVFKNKLESDLIKH